MHGNDILMPVTIDILLNKYKICCKTASKRSDACKRVTINMVIIMSINIHIGYYFGHLGTSSSCSSLVTVTRSIGWVRVMGV